MEMHSIQEKLKQIQTDEEEKTIEFIRSNLGRNSKILDISNKYLIKDSFDYFTASLLNHFTTFNTYKSLVLENCLLSNKLLIKLLNKLSKMKMRHNVIHLDLSNNQIEINEKLSEKISRFFEGSFKPKQITLNLQGNLIIPAMVMTKLLSVNRDFKELSLYDTRLSPEALLALSEVLAKNKVIIKLDLSYNPSAFTSSEVVHTFGISIGINSNIESLNLSGNTSIQKDLIFIKFLSGISNNKSLQELIFGNLNLKDKSLEIVAKIIFPVMPLMILDLQSNFLTAKGIDLLLGSLSYFVISLDVSYNDFRNNSVLDTFGKFFRTSRTLRKLNISYSIELQHLNHASLESFCKGITENISLGELWCEGMKIGDDPDEFCSKVGDAISNRKHSLTFKISAVNCFAGSQNSSIISHRSSRNDFKFA
jgi:DNA-binding Lrp family transcriptional regulator